MARVIRPSWQIVCHVSDIAKPRRLPHARLYRRKRHRGARRRWRNPRLRQCLPPPRDAAGRRARRAARRSWSAPITPGPTISTGGCAACRCAPIIPRSTWRRAGLAPVEVEIWRGFVFVRLEDDGGPSVAEMMAPYDAEIAPYRFEDMRTLSPVRAPRARGQLEECRRQLFGRPPHPRRPCRADPAVRQELCDRGRALGRQDVGPAGRSPLGQPVGALLPDASAARAASARGEPAAVALLQALAQHGVRHLSPTRSISCSGCRCRRPRSLLREMAFALPDDRREMKLVALRQLADQPHGQCRGHLADRRASSRAWPRTATPPGRSARARCACAVSRGRSAG